MATATSRARCITCGKEKVAYKCEGCSQQFCFNHLGEHRQQLGKQLDEIEVHRDLLQQTLIQYTTESQEHPLIQQINQWEQDSITKIQQTAQEAKQLLSKHANKHINQIDEKLNRLTNQLKLSRQEDDIIETDLQKWKEELQQMAEELTKPLNIIIQRSSTSLINKIYVDIASRK